MKDDDKRLGALIIITILFLFAVALVGCGHRHPAPVVKESLTVQAPAEVVELGEKTVTKTDSTGFVLVEFSAKWCGPCKRQAANVAALEADKGGYSNVYSVDVDDNLKAAQDAIINPDYPHIQVPCHIVFKDGVEMVRHYGVHTRTEMLTWLDEAKAAAAR